jgi:hypothetical protein
VGVVHLALAREDLMSTYATDKAGTATEKLLEKAKKCAKQAWAAESDQRAREKRALQFQVGEYQWDDAAKAQRAGGTYGNQAYPPRPMLSISKLDQPIQLVLNQARAAKLGVNIHPVSEDATDDTAEVLQGIYRRIERDSNADQARLWALDRATKSGRGVYRVTTKFDEDAPPETFDQEIVIERILYQDSVYFDPSAQKPDFSDGDWAFESLWMTPDRFRREFPGASEDFTSAGDFATIASQEPDWFEGDGEGRKILVIVYWYKEHETKEVVRERDGAKFKRDIVSVKRCWVNAVETLETEDWNGKYIPLIPVIGRELQPFDNERRWVGMVEPAMHAQMFHNYAASNLVERMALEPRVPWMVAEGQDEGYEQEFLSSNVRNLPVLHYKPTSLGDKLVGPPQRTPIDNSGMNLAVEGLQMSNDWIQSVTGIYDPSLGKIGKEKSGRQVLALQQQADAGNNHFLASLADTTLPYEARVIMDLIPHIYDRPGRVTRILGGEDDVKPVMLNAPFKIDQNTGRPIPARPGEQGTKTHDLTATYTVSVSIGKSYQTRMQEGQEEIGAILQADPSLMPLIGSIYFRYRDSPGSKEIAEILKEVREKQYPGLGENKDQGPTPEQLQAKLSAMEQQGQMMQQQLQMAIQAIQTKQAEQEGKIRVAEIQAQANERLAAAEAAHQEKLQVLKNAGAIAVAETNAQAKGVQLANEAVNENQALARQHDFEAEEADRDRAHEVAMAASGGRTMTVGREGGQEEGSEQSQETGREESSGTSQEASSEPEPTDEGGEA